MGSCLSPYQPPPIKTKKSLESYARYDIKTHIVPSNPDSHPEMFDHQHLLTDMEKLSTLNNIEELLPLQRIKYIFERYINLTEEKETLSESNGIYSFLNHELGGDYNNTQLLNDYYYLLFNYDNQLEQITNYLINAISTLNPTNLTYFNRNYRDRNANNSTIYDVFTDDPKERNTVQLIDRIYCYFIYTFKMGYKLKKNDIFDTNQQPNKNENIDEIIRDNKILEMNSIVKQQRNKYVKQGLNGCENMKYKYYINMGCSNELNVYSDHENDIKMAECSHVSTSLDMMIDRIPSNNSLQYDYTQSTTNSSLNILPNMESLGHDANKLSFRKSASVKLFQRKKSVSQKTDYNDTMVIGYRYYYWDYFINHKKKDENNPGYLVRDWYIAKKYMDLKTELLEHCLDMDEYQEVLYKSQDIMNCMYSRNIVNNYYWYTREYGLASDIVISLQHIMSVCVYCNFYNIQSAFNNTFYRKSINETDEALKQRHSGFYNLGKLLRECVECFGQEITKAKHDKFYVIINENMLFGQIYAKISIPLCSSTECGVIMNYINNNNNDGGDTNGLMLELCGDNNNPCDFFDCKFISDFVNEKQVLFIGGFERLKFNAVIDIHKGINYGIYLKAMNILNYIIKKRKTSNNNYGNNEMNISSMMKEIIINLLRNEIKRQSVSVVDDDINENKYIDVLFNYYVKSVYGIKLDLIKIKNDYSFLCPIFGINNNKNEGWIDIRVLLNLFPNINVINLTGINKLTQNMVNAIYSDIIPNDVNCKALYKLILNYSNIAEQIIEKLLNDNIDKFQSKSWKIVKKYRSLSFERIHLLN